MLIVLIKCPNCGNDLAEEGEGSKILYCKECGYFEEV